MQFDDHARINREPRVEPRLGRQAAGAVRVQRAADWMFLLTVEWFGLPDDRKRHTEQLDYGFKGRSNDQLRQEWMRKVVPFCDDVGIDVPAHFEDVMAEIRLSFEAHRQAGTWPGGVHIELTGENVTECLGGAEEILDDQLGELYTTMCDPRLNARQSLDLFRRLGMKREQAEAEALLARLGTGD